MEEMAKKRVKDSETEQSYLLMHRHINGYGRLFGGQLVAWIDEMAGLVGRRHPRRLRKSGRRAAVKAGNMQAGGTILWRVSGGNYKNCSPSSAPKGSGAHHNGSPVPHSKKTDWIRPGSRKSAYFSAGTKSEQ